MTVVRGTEKRCRVHPVRRRGSHRVSGRAGARGRCGRHRDMGGFDAGGDRGGSPAAARQSVVQPAVAAADPLATMADEPHRAARASPRAHPEEVPLLERDACQPSRVGIPSGEGALVSQVAYRCAAHDVVLDGTIVAPAQRPVEADGSSVGVKHPQTRSEKARGD